MAELKKQFPQVNKKGKATKKDFKKYPYCMLARCVTVRDRLIFLNMWQNLDKDRHIAYEAVYTKAFPNPTISGRLYEEMPKAEYIGILDDHERRKQLAGSSASYRVLNAKQNRLADECPTSNAQMYDKISRSRSPTRKVSDVLHGSH